jgi:hypothetical protein
MGEPRSAGERLGHRSGLHRRSERPWTAHLGPARAREEADQESAAFRCRRERRDLRTHGAQKQRVDTEVARLADLGATMVRILFQQGIDHYAVAMTDPEGNEFDVN